MNTALSSAMGARIRELRRARKWSQSDLARQIGVTKASVGQYESGDRSPSYEVLLRIADTFSVTADYLLRGNETDIRIRAGSLNGQQIEALTTIIRSMQNSKE